MRTEVTAWLTDPDRPGRGPTRADRLRSQRASGAVAHLRDEYADLPLLVIGEDASAPWTELEGPQRVWRVPADASSERLTSVIEEALTEQGMAV